MLVVQKSIVDESDKTMPLPDYVVRMRQYIGQDLLMLIGASAIVFNDRGELLLQKRSDNGLWGLPGGSIDPGEEPAEAVIREVYEETGLHVIPYRLVGVYGGPDLVLQYPNGDQIAVISICFKCRVLSGSLRLDDDESLDLDYFSPDSLPETLMPFHRSRIQHVLQRTHPYFALSETLPEPLSAPDYIHQLRQQVGTEAIFMPGTAGVIQNDRDDILLVKRADNGMWSLPGGALEPGEEPADALQREVYEETGLHVHPERLIGVYGGEAYRMQYPGGDQVDYIGVMFQCRVIGGIEEPDHSETLALRWVSPDDLPLDLMAHHREVIQHAVTCDTPFFRIPSDNPDDKT